MKTVLIDAGWWDLTGIALALSVGSMSCCDSSPKPPSETVAASCCEPESKKIDWILWISLAVVAWAVLWNGWDGRSLTSMDQVASSIVHTTHEMIFGILIGVVIVGVLEHIPKETVGAVIGSHQGWRGIGRAMLAGLVLDLCNHGILLIGMSLYRKGASLGQVFAFLIASPWNSFSLTIILASLIGIPWTAIFIVGSGVIAFIAGLLAERCVERGIVPQNPHRCTLPEKTDWKKIRTELGQMDRSFKGILKMLWTGVLTSKMLFRWLFLGTIITALIQVYVPSDWYRSWFGPSELGLLMTLLAATIIEVCSEGSLPIAADLFTRAHAPGNAFTFLMAGASTDYTEIIMLKETTGSWKAALVLPLLTVPQILWISWVMNKF